MRMRRKLQNAYNTPSYSEAKRSLDGIKKELKLMNVSSAKSLEEGLEETLTLQRLGLFEELGRSFKTTNCIENLNRQIEQYTGRVCRWKTSDQRQRWVASAIVEIEPRLRKIKGHHHLKTLRERMKTNQPIVKERLAA
jgi:transposase-like protein